MHTSSQFIEDDLNNRGYLWIPRVYAQEIKVDFIADRTARSLSPRSFFNGRSSIVTFISQALIYVMPVYINSLHLFDPFIAILPSIATNDRSNVHCYHYTDIVSFLFPIRKFILSFILATVQFPEATSYEIIILNFIFIFSFITK